MIKNIKEQFPWFDKNKGWTYLDSGATTLKPKCVIDRIMEYYECESTNPHNTDSELTRKVNKELEDTRILVANFFGADKNEILFTSGATESSNMIANMIELKKNSEIIVSYLEHTSNLLPWIDLANKNDSTIVYPEKNKIHNVDSILRLITSKTKVIAVSSVYNLLGNSLNINDLVKQAKVINKDLIFVLDATQNAPHAKLNVKELGVDFMFCSAHKMCGPTGVGVLYGKKKLLENNNACKLGGGMNSIVEPNKFEFAPLPDKFEGGSPNIAGILGFGAAIKFLNEVDMIEITMHEKKLKKYIDEQFQTIEGLEYYSQDSEFPVCAFNIKGIHPQDLANYLGNNKIIVRGGVSCAKLQKYVTGVESGFVRATFYLYSTEEDVDTLVKALKSVKRNEVLDSIL